MAIVQPSAREYEFSDHDFRFLAKLANQKTGIVLTENKRDMIYGRLAKRLRALGLGDFAEYCAFLQSDKGADEIGNLINAVTTNLTGFFRESHHFDHLYNEVLLPYNKQAKPLRIWSAACSSGMEPYSIAMTMGRALSDFHKREARVLATDIDSAMLARGRAGRYTTADVEKVPAAYRRYYETEGENAIMSDSLKEMIRFNHLNLLESWPMRGMFDVIFCRNVVIYFDKPTKERLFARMAEKLVPGGWLYIGHSESLHGISDEFELIGRTIYQRRV